MMRKYLAMLFLVFIYACTPDSRDGLTEKLEVEPIDTITYSASGFNHQRNLLLFSNGLFEYTDSQYGCMGGGEIKKYTGTFSQLSNHLSLNPICMDIRLLDDEFRITQKTDTSYSGKKYEIATNYDLINWRHKTFLISGDFYGLYDDGNAYHEFARNFNVKDKSYCERFFLTKEIEDTCAFIPELDLNQIPIEWRFWFSRDPIKTQISKISKSIHPNNDETLVCNFTLNKGFNDKILKYLELSNKEGDFYFYIDSVLPEQSFGHLYVDSENDRTLNIKVGTTLQTYW